jgi:pantoate--beta-alanine ligase
VPTIREPDGLALSSRNAYLTPSERAIAPLLYTVLVHTANELQAGADVAKATADAAAALQRAGFAPVEYVTLADPETLQPLTAVNGDARLLAAAWLGRARLIDNVAVAPAVGYV